MLFEKMHTVHTHSHASGHTQTKLRHTHIMKFYSPSVSALLLTELLTAVFLKATVTAAMTHYNACACPKYLHPLYLE